MPAEEDLSRLSVSELKKRLFWCGASVPSGHLEKSDLVAALTKALAEKAEKERKAAEQAEQQKKAQAGVPRPDPRPLSYDKKGTKDQQEVVDLHVMPEEELRKQIETAGGTIPEGSVSRFYLIALLKNAQRQAAELAAQAAAEAAEAEEQPPPPPPPESDGAATAVSANPPCGGDAGTAEEVFDDKDPAELSAGELKRRLLAYGAYGEEKLKGLAEKPEFIAALREAIAERGAPPQPQRAPAAQAPAQAPGGVAVRRPPARKPVEISEEEAMAQMQELAAHLEAEEVCAAARAGEAAAEAAAPVEVADEPVPAAPARPLARTGRRARPNAPEAPAPRRPAAAAAAPHAAAARTARGKRKRPQGEVLVSDGEDEVCAVGVAPIDLDGDEEAPGTSAEAAVAESEAYVFL